MLIEKRLDISVQEAIQIVEKQHLLPGISIQQEPVRYYPYGSLAAHVIGYISQINEHELAKSPDRKLGDLVGKYGIENLFDNILRGKDGKTIVEASQKCVLEKKEFCVDSFVLYKSVLLSSGPEYSVLKRFSCRVS